MKAADLRELSVDELRARETDLEDAIFRLRIQKSMGHLEAPGKVRTERRTLARLKTILAQKTLEQGRGQD
ncbi:MAG: 50S ribosomal protein L29 [Acidimicrobiia bacterium]|nr:50S ribosomal protein L29 [Acidimicrobiia bacterium]